MKIKIRNRQARCAAFVSVLCVMNVTSACAQNHDEEPSAMATSETTTLPEAPSFLPRIAADPTGTSVGWDPAASPDVAKKYKRTIKPGQTAQPLTPGDKLVLSVVNRASVSSLAGTFFAAGYSHLADNRPHYGVDKGAFGERLGAIALNQASTSILSYGVYASLFHDDPRYYVLGHKQKLSKRMIYAATRVVITRKDNGTSAINWPRLAGIASAVALTNAYYPERDRRVGRTITSILTSYATNAGTNQINEFQGDASRLFRHKD